MRLLAVLLVGFGCLARCGGSTIDSADAGADVVYGHKPFDAAVRDVVKEAAPKIPFDRMQPHGKNVLSAPRVVAIYVDTGGPNAPYDGYLSWLVTSTDYWSILAQYGVGYGTFVGSVHIDRNALLPGMVNSGYVDDYVLAEQIRSAIHQTGDGGLPPVPQGDAYVVFIDVNVNLGGDKTCGNIGGYHSADGLEAYSVLPPCGHGGLAISHEMAEMVTDPFGDGWYSDAEVANAGGEIGDLCNAPIPFDGHVVTELWSNHDGDCEPTP